MMMLLIFSVIRCTKPSDFVVEINGEEALQKPREFNIISRRPGYTIIVLCLKSR